MRTLRLITMLSLVALSPGAWASSGDDVTRRDFRSALCNIDSMTLRIKLDEAFGEPLVTSRMRWTAGPNTSANCLSQLTHVWVKARTFDNRNVWIRVSPEVVESGKDFSGTATESPNWGSLFCEAPDHRAKCLEGDVARYLFRSEIRFDSLEVVTTSRTLSTIGRSTSSSDTGKQLDNDAFSLDSLLSDAVNDAIDPGATAEPETPELTPAQIAEQLSKQRDEHARDAVNNVVTLIASSLAQYTAPAHECESERNIANWVQARGTCQLNFRSEANHEFLCAESGEVESVRATRRANINLETDLANVSPIRVSEEGWASVVLELSGELRSTTEGDYKTNRWHFTASSEKAEDLQRLASSLLTLRDYCQSGS